MKHRFPIIKDLTHKRTTNMHPCLFRTFLFIFFFSIYLNINVSQKIPIVLISQHVDPFQKHATRTAFESICLDRIF